MKSNLTRFPYAIGVLAARTPFSWRPGIGKGYRKAHAEILEWERKDSSSKENYVFTRVKAIAEYAYGAIPFYRELYDSAGINPSDLSHFDDIKQLPIVTKKMLQSVPLKERSSNVFGRSIANTGGSSGQPLEFYIQPSAIPHEWAHIHHAWANLGFRPHDLKIMFVGRTKVNNIVDYDSARHSLVVDTYKGWEIVAEELYKKAIKYKPRFLHGYPSAIFDFVDWLDRARHPLIIYFQEYLQGIILSSELPNAVLRERVESLLKCSTISFYGHTERCVLAAERSEKGFFDVYQTYGHAEVNGDGREGSLIGTSYYNYASPLVRYDTGDLIDPVVEGRILTGFSISKGREGEFIIDRYGHKVFLTAFIFGRHHPVFNYAAHVQVRQVKPGEAELLVTARESLSAGEALSLFDLDNVNVCFQVSILSEPIVTVSGKVPLLVKSDHFVG